MSIFGSCNSTTKNKLLHQYCTTMYGSHLWDLTRQSVKTFCTKWHTVHRMALSLPYNTHCNLLPLIAENRPLDCVLEYRYIGFYKTILEPKNNIVKHIAHTRLYDYTFTMGRIMLHMSKYDLCIDYIRSLYNTNIDTVTLNG